MSVPFGEVTWAQDIHSPWSNVQSSLQEDAVREGFDSRSSIKAQAYELANCCKPEDFIMDEPSRSFTQPYRIVIVGTEKLKRPGSSHRMIYGLVVTQVAGKRNIDYERAGVATLEESLILRTKPSVAIRII
jgi:hypothetical protein